MSEWIYSTFPPPGLFRPLEVYLILVYSFSHLRDDKIPGPVWLYVRSLQVAIEVPEKANKFHTYYRPLFV